MDPKFYTNRAEDMILILCPSFRMFSKTVLPPMQSRCKKHFGYDFLRNFDLVQAETFTQRENDLSVSVRKSPVLDRLFS
ncbi:hypothetical protein DLM78_21270 [Leptospira stimsonii]|uniref:Uncharacterized protein n=1 Tax=Leptospira stimsonii TaxID=2202203 RepID=A0A8B3CIT5_9LEPT|nr:hypothetical protein DLM78_21270 [Leptospira stimsonii]